MDNRILHFESDYMEGAHPLILQRLVDTNFEKTPGYGEDAYCESAKAKIRTACACPKADIHFLVGGTQTNTTIIAAVLRSWQGVIARATGHVAVHVAVAIESTGHKVITLPHNNGKLEAKTLESYLNTFEHDANRDHMVEPGMVYISHPTEYGTLYTKQELESLHNVCSTHHLPLFLDGARLGYGLAAEKTDVTLPVSILDELTAAIGTEERSDFDRRYPGRIGELLFNCWLEHQLDSGIITRRNICEIPFMYTEKVNHIEKAWGFLRAKYSGVKQEKSI